MKKILYVVVILLSFVGRLYGQIEEIVLPDIKIELQAPDNFEHHSFYVTPNQELYFEEKRLHYWDQVPANILAMKREPTFKKVDYISIYADQTIPYRFLQRLRAEIGKVWTGHLIFKSVSLDDENGMSIFNNGSELQSKRMDLLHDFIFSSNTIYTKGEKDGNASVQRGPNFLPPPPAIWQHNFSADLYGLDTLHINSVLANLDYAVIEVVTDSIFRFKGENLVFGGNTKLKTIVQENDLLLLKFNFDLTYGAFFKAMSYIQRLRIRDEKSMHGILPKPFTIDISYEFEEELKKIGIDFFETGNQ